MFSCGSISRDLGASHWYQETGCRTPVLAGADLAGVMALEPMVPVMASLFLAFPLWQRLGLLWQDSFSVSFLDSGSAVYTPFIQSFQWCFEHPIAHIKSLLRYKIIFVICYWTLTILFLNLSYFLNIMTSVSLFKILKNWPLLTSWKSLFFCFWWHFTLWFLLHNSFTNFHSILLAHFHSSDMYRACTRL